MRCRFMAQSACLRLGALLVEVVVVVGDWAACPSLLLQSRGCIMAPIRSFPLWNKLTLCSRVLVCVCRHKVQDRLVVEQSGGTATRESFVCLWVGIGKSSDLKGWVQRFPLT